MTHAGFPLSDQCLQHAPSLDIRGFCRGQAASFGADIVVIIIKFEIHAEVADRNRRA
jgi:hypothetical protein